MREPLRFRDDQGAPSELRALLRGADRSRRLPPEVRARSAARLDRLLALPAASGLLLWLKGLAVAAVVGGVGAVTVSQTLAVLEHGHAPPAAVSAAPHARSVAPRGNTPRPVQDPVKEMTAPATSAIPAQVPAPLPSATTASVAPPARSPIASPPRAPRPAEIAPLPVASNAADALSAQAALLERARASLERDPAATLAQIDALAVAYPDGALRTEREFLAVDALSRLGRADAARARGEALLGEGHGSLYEDRVRAILERLPAH